MKSILVFLVLITYMYSSSEQITGAVKMYNGRPVIMINDHPQYPLIYALTDVPGGRWSWEELPNYNIQNFYKNGFRLFQLDIFFDHIWKEDNSVNLDTLQMQINGLLKYCPEAALILRFHVNSPKWWQRLHPEENTLYADTIPTLDMNWGVQRMIQDDERTPLRTSLASARWKAEAGEKLKEVLLKLKRLPEANALAGIQVAGGIYGEWHYWGFLENEPDVSKPMADYFKQWLKEKYKNNKQLQFAWKDKTVSLENATLPSLEEKRNTKAGIFRSPTEEGKTIDYYKAQHNCVADDILFFCKVIKDNWPRPIMTGAFYGYFYAVFGRETAGGHLASQKLLNSPYIDFLCAPAAYYPESSQTGDAYRSRGLINSAILHNKLWLDEMDQQSPLLSLKDSAFKISLHKSIANVRRNMLYTYTHGTGFWFYDFGPSGFNGGSRLNDHGSYGWWDEPTLMNEIKKLKSFFDSSISKPFTSDADVLLVHDTKTFYYTGSNRQSSYMGHWANNWIPPAIFKSGAIHDVIHLDDLDKVNIDQYKAVIFVNTWVLNNEQKELIKNRISKNNRHLIWLYAPGYSDDKELNKKFITQVTGIELKQLKTNSPVTMITDSNITKHNRFTVFSREIDPLFIADDDKAIVLGKLDSIGGAAMVKKQQPGFTSWYMSIPPADTDLWRYVFNESGVHIYEKSNDVLYAGKGMLSIHALIGGERKIVLKNGKEITVVLQSNSTTLINSVTGEIVSR